MELVLIWKYIPLWSAFRPSIYIILQYFNKSPHYQFSSFRFFHGSSPYQCLKPPGQHLFFSVYHHGFDFYLAFWCIDWHFYHCTFSLTVSCFPCFTSFYQSCELFFTSLLYSPLCDYFSIPSLLSYSSVYRVHEVGTVFQFPSRGEF